MDDPPEGETVEEAGAREMFEETGFHIDKANLRLTHSFSMGDGHLLVFMTCQRPMSIKVLETFEKNSECSAVRVAWAPENLCFSSHTDALARWFRDEHTHFLGDHA